MARTLPALAAVLVAIAIVGPASARTHGPVAAPTGAAHPIVAAAQLEEEVLGAINDVRRRHGLGALRLNPQLSTVARAHSRSMAEHGYFDHASSDGSAFWHRLEPVFAPVRGERWEVGENLVWGTPGLTPAQALEMWLKSPPHRRNLLSSAWREVGLGGVHALAAPGVYGGNDVTILTADFGVR